MSNCRCSSCSNRLISLSHQYHQCYESICKYDPTKRPLAEELKKQDKEIAAQVNHLTNKLEGATNAKHT